MCSILLFLVSTSAFGNEIDDYINIIDNNVNIKTLEHNILKLEIDVDNALRESKNAEKSLIRLNDLPFGVGSEAIEGLEYVRDVVPYQIQNVYDQLLVDYENAINEIFIGYRMIEMGLLVDYNSLELARLKKVNAQDRFDSDSLKYNLGKVSLSEYMESEYGLLQATLDLEKAQRKYDDSVRNYNNYLGRSLDTKIELSDVKMIILSELDYDLTVDEAYKNYSLVRKLAVEDEFQEKLIDFYEDYDFQRNTTAARTYRDAKHTIEKNTLLKELYFDDIEVKVFKQLKSLEISKNQIAQLLNTIESQNIDYNQLKLQFEQGYLSKSTINEYEIVLVQLEQNLDLLIFDYNTKIYELMTWIGDNVEVNE
jgi:hypothetical protein